MQNVELTRVAGLIVDVLDMMGYSTDKILVIADLMGRHAVIQDKYAGDDRSARETTADTLS